MSLNINQYLNSTDTSMLKLITSAFHSLPDLIYIMAVHEENFVYYFANQSALSLLDNHHSIIGKSFEDLFTKERADFLKHFYGKAIKYNKTVSFEEDIVVDNKYINYETVLTPITNDNEMFIVAVVRDITERTKRTKELIHSNYQLEKNKQRLTSLIDNNEDGVFMLDLDGFFLEANDASENIIGYHPFELIGTSLSQMIPTQEISRIKALFQKVLEGDTVHFETTLIHKNGSEVFINLKCIPITINGNTTGVYGIAKDISKEKKTLDELQNVKKQLESFINDNTDSIFLTNMNKEVLFTNDSFTTMFGFTREETLYKPNPIIPEWVIDEANQMYEQILSGTKMQNIQVICQKKSGALLDISITLSPIYDELGQITGVSHIYRDITEMKRNEIEIMKIKNELELVWNNSTDAIFLIAQNGMIIKANPNFKNYFSWDETGDNYLKHSSIYLDYQVKQTDEILTKLHEQKDMLQFETKRRRKDGSIIDVVATYNPINDKEILAIVTYKDITKEKQAMTVLKNNEEKYRNMVESSPDALMIHREGTITYINPAGLKLLKAENPNQLINRQLLDFVHPKSKVQVEERFKNQLSERVEEIYLTTSGEKVYVETNASTIQDRGRNSMIITLRDVLKRRRAEKILKESEERFRIIAEHSKSIIKILDLNGKIFYASPPLEETLGYLICDVIGNSILDHIHRDDRTKAKDAIQTIISTGKPLELEMRHIHQDGYSIWLNSNFTPIFSSEGEIEKFIVISEDITDSKMKEKKLKQMAYYDYLTGLPNRRLFIERLSQAILTSKKTGTLTTLMVLDCDKFKQINDTLGHDVGDEVIKEFAKRVQMNIRKKDTLSRLGGDEFTIVFPEVKDKEEIEFICNQILDRVKQPIFINGHEIYISTSIGISYYPEAKNEEILFKNANNNLYVSKERGGDTFTM